LTSLVAESWTSISVGLGFIIWSSVTLAKPSTTLARQPLTTMGAKHAKPTRTPRRRTDLSQLSVIHGAFHRSGARMAEFNTLTLRLLKVAARFVEKAAHVRILFASACPDAVPFRLLPRCSATALA
jgi:hypothetical protein